MASVSTVPDHEEALDGLARTIRKHRLECPPHETARRVLAYETPGNTAVVGVNDNATRAILYHEREEYVIAVPFGPDGLEAGGPIIADFDFGSNVYSWVRKTRYYWGWLNPRFQ